MLKSTDDKPLKNRLFLQNKAQITPESRELVPNSRDIAP